MVYENIVIAAIAGLSTAIPTIAVAYIISRGQNRKLDVAQVTNVKQLDKLEEVKKTNELQLEKLEEVKTVAVETAEIAVESTKEAAEVANKAAVVTETIHGLVNSSLATEKLRADDAETKNDQLVAILASAGVKVPPGVIAKRYGGS